MLVDATREPQGNPNFSADLVWCVIAAAAAVLVDIVVNDIDVVARILISSPAGPIPSPIDGKAMLPTCSDMHASTGRHGIQLLDHRHAS